MYACIRELHQKGSNDGVLPERYQATVRTSAGMLSKGAPGDKFNEIVIQMRSFSLKKLYCINVVCKNLILTRSQCVKVPDTVIAFFFFFIQNIFNQDYWSAKGCFAWGPAIYNTIDKHSRNNATWNMINHDTYDIKV